MERIPAETTSFLSSNLSLALISLAVLVILLVLSWGITSLLLKGATYRDEY